MIPGKRYLTKFKSKSSPDGEYHRVFQDTKTGQVTCTCKGFIHRQKCWHVEQVTERLIERYSTKR